MIFRTGFALHILSILFLTEFFQNADGCKTATQNQYMCSFLSSTFHTNLVLDSPYHLISSLLNIQAKSSEYWDESYRFLRIFHSFTRSFLNQQYSIQLFLQLAEYAGQIKPKPDWNSTTTKTIWFPQKGNLGSHHQLPNNNILLEYLRLIR